MKKFLQRTAKFIDRVSADHVGAYAAQSSFFLVLSLIPIILLLLTLIRYTPLTKADVISAAYDFFPASIRLTIVSIVNEVYNQSRAIIPLTALVAIWSAGRGTMAITGGLNCVHQTRETRNYIYVRIRAAFYTVVLIIAIVVSLIIVGFGDDIGRLLNEYIPAIRYITDLIIRIRTLVTFVILTLFSACVYKFLPNVRVKFIRQLPGALFTSLGWLGASFFISVYMDIFKGFSNMYGSLTTIVLIMLWFYFCMYILLLGGELNVILSDRLKSRAKKKKE